MGTAPRSLSLSFSRPRPRGIKRFLRVLAHTYTAHIYLHYANDGAQERETTLIIMHRAGQASSLHPRGAR